MAFPPRPPPGMMPGFPPPGVPPPGFGHPPPLMRPPYAAHAEPRLRMAVTPNDPANHVGPPVTVFVGNITDKAQDAMIRHVLNTCGPVVSWKRVQGATGKLQAFGFCEFSNAESALRAIHILHDWQIADKKLVVKVDAKTQDTLDEFKKKKMAQKGVEVYEDAEMKAEDESVTERIRGIIKEHSKDMDAYGSHTDERKRTSRPEGESYRLTGPKESLDDVELEDGKRDIIHREIDKFRETVKIREAEKEAEKARLAERSPKPPSKSSSLKRSRSRTKERSPVRQRRERTRDRSRERIRDMSRERTRDRSQERRSRDRSRERIRERSRSRERARSRDRGRDTKDVRREREQDEEDKERKKADRRARDKENSYQERLRKWVAREEKMARTTEAERVKEVRRVEDMCREGVKMREFLEDYDDDRDDEKFYRGSKLDRRLQERGREAARDAEDRAREKEEIEELRTRIYSEGHADPNAELERRLALLDPNRPVEVVDLEPDDDEGVSPPHDDGVIILNDDDVAMPDVNNDDDLHQNSIGLVESNVVSEEEEDAEATPPPQVPEAVEEKKPPAFQMVTTNTRKKIDVRDVFNQDEDDAPSSVKKRLPPLPTKSSTKSSSNTTTASAPTSDDKRKHIKSLIDKIPTDRNALFEYKIDWDMVDNQLMEKRIRPWVNKKINEYIGEPEPTLTDFICSKVLAGSSPKAVLDDVQMVLDEEAEVFVVKMWRLLIYEIENKKFKALATADAK